MAESVQAGVRKKCRHCGSGTVTRPRQLCWACYYRPGVREQYVRMTACGKVRGPDPPQDQPPYPDEPTDSQPGSPEKLQVMIRRAEQGRYLYHPDDNTARETEADRRGE